jgi:hypothetical protein
MRINIHSPDSEALTFEALAAAKRLPADFLRGLGLTDTADGVAVPYFDATSEAILVRKRIALDGPKKCLQPRAVALQAYGAERLDEAARSGTGTGSGYLAPTSVACRRRSGTRWSCAKSTSFTFCLTNLHRSSPFTKSDRAGPRSRPLANH